MQSTNEGSNNLKTVSHNIILHKSDLRLILYTINFIYKYNNRYFCAKTKNLKKIMIYKFKVVNIIL